VLTRAYLKQICIDGFWHCDPHPGNVFIPTDDDTPPYLILLDFGMVSRVSQEFQDEIIKLLLNISSNRGTETAEACIRMSEPLEAFDTIPFIRDISMIVAAVHDSGPRDINTGQLLFNVISVANNHALKVPPELAMLAKTLLHLDAITKKLDPLYDPQAVIRDYAENMISQKLVQKLNPRNFYASLLDLNQLLQELPRRTREIVDLTAAGKLTFGIKMLQAEELLAGIHKVANRITVGLIIAAIVVASALMIRTQPFLAVIGYITSALIGLYLVISTILHDRKDRERAKTKAK
jgi:predicted unusual protein kinase regulating ubiquinone biosynthesis (AarF/ABC1/UbiB family)